MSYSHRITVDLTPPQPPTYLEETLAPFISWGGYFIEQLSAAPSNILDVVGRIGSCTTQAFKTTKDAAIDCLIEILPILITYSTHEFILSKFPDQPIFYFAQSSICYASGKYLHFLNEIPSAEAVSQGIERGLQKLHINDNKKASKLLALNEMQNLPITAAPSSMAPIRTIMGISLTTLGIAYIAQGTSLALHRIYG